MKLESEELLGFIFLFAANLLTSISIWWEHDDIM